MITASRQAEIAASAKQGESKCPPRPRIFYPGTPHNRRAPENSETDLVTGETVPNRYSAGSNRYFETIVFTLAGKWWTEKEPQ